MLESLDLIDRVDAEVGHRVELAVLIVRSGARIEEGCGHAPTMRAVPKSCPLSSYSLLTSPTGAASALRPAAAGAARSSCSERSPSSEQEVGASG